MITYFCPSCWAFLEADLAICPHCGYQIDEFTPLPYEDKLLHALHHPNRDTRLIAIRALGDLHSCRALQEFEHQIKASQTDFFTVREIIFALAKIPSSKSRELLQWLRSHPSKLVRKAVDKVLDDIDSLQLNIE